MPLEDGGQLTPQDVSLQREDQFPAAGMCRSHTYFPCALEPMLPAAFRLLALVKVPQCTMHRVLGGLHITPPRRVSVSLLYSDECEWARLQIRQ